MEAILSAIPQLVDVVTKGGVPGVLLLACGVFIYEIKRARRREHDIRNELAIVYGQRDKLGLAVVKCKTLLEANNIKVDLSDLDNLLPAVVQALPNGG